MQSIPTEAQIDEMISNAKPSGKSYIWIQGSWFTRSRVMFNLKMSKFKWYRRTFLKYQNDRFFKSWGGFPIIEKEG